MELSLTKFLHDHPNNWDELLRQPPYSLTIKEKGNYLLFKYNQFESDFSLSICHEARGIIYDKRTLQPVCVPFFKFFNYGEQWVDELDEDSTIITEKIDGYLVKLWWYEGNWHMSSNGMIDAFDAVLDGGKSVGDLFEDAVHEPFWIYAEDAQLSHEYTYMFEVVHPDYPLTIKYDEPQIYLIGVRSMTTLNELPPSYVFYDSPFPHPDAYNLTFSQAITKARTYKGKDLEGFVAVDKYGRRIKIKTLVYLERFHSILMTEKFTARHFCHIYKEGVLDDLVSAASLEWRKKAKHYIDLLLNECERYEQLYIDNNLYKVKDRRLVPELAKNYGVPQDYVFKKLDGRISAPMDYLNWITEQRMRQLLTDLLKKENENERVNRP